MSILGTLAIGVVIPIEEINLNAGIVQTFLSTFTHMHVEWLVVLVAIMLAVGIIAQLSTWGLLVRRKVFFPRQ